MVATKEQMSKLAAELVSGMDEPGEVEKQKRLVEFDGKFFEMRDISPKQLVHEAKQHLLKSRSNTLKTVAAELEGMPAEVQKLFVTEAIKRATSNQVTLDEVNDWLRTDDGVVFVFWCSLRDSVGKSFTLDKAREVFYENMSKEAEAAMARRRAERDGASASEEKPPEDASVGDAENVSVHGYESP